MRLSIHLLLALAMSALGMNPAAHAADATFYTATYVEVVPPSAVEGAALLRQYRQASRQDADNLRFEVLQRLDRPNQFTILAAWTDQKAFEAHAAAAPTREFRDKLRPLLASPNDERLHNALSVGPAPAAGAAGTVYAVTHVDVIPPRKDDAVTLLKQLVEDSRKDPGNVRFDVVQQTNRPNHFTVVEAWKDRQTFDAHGMAAHTRLFRDQLTPMSGALYDERLYVPLN
jgi:quinol monooxygenase YgiN